MAEVLLIANAGDVEPTPITVGVRFVTGTLSVRKGVVTSGNAPRGVGGGTGGRLEPVVGSHDGNATCLDVPAGGHDAASGG